MDVFNPWADYDSDYDGRADAFEVRSQHLRDYLTARVHQTRYILVAEAVGYQGGKFSGVPITSERMLLGNHPSITPHSILSGGKGVRTSNPKAASSRTVQQGGYAEPTATIVWDALGSLPISCFEVILWNIFPFHPYKPEVGRLSNRTPRAHELVSGLAFLDDLLSLCPLQVQVIAIGEKAAATIGGQCPKVPHPANGGATLFRTSLPRHISA